MHGGRTERDETTTSGTTEPDSGTRDRNQGSQTTSGMKPATRANFLPEPRFVPLRPALQEHLSKLGAAVTPDHFLSICDEMVLKILQESFARISADEGSIWLLDPAKENLVVAYNSGPNSEKIMGFKQPTSKGIISLVVASEHAF